MCVSYRVFMLFPSPLETMSEKRMFLSMNQIIQIHYINEIWGEVDESKSGQTPYRGAIFTFTLSECNGQLYPLRINTGDKSVACRSYSVVAHHEALSRLRPGFKSRYEHSFDVIML